MKKVNKRFGSQTVKLIKARYARKLAIIDPLYMKD